MQELSFAEIMSYAAIAEDNAIVFYRNAAAKVSLRNVRLFLEELALMEEGHKRHIEDLLSKFEKSGKIPKLHKEIHNLGYADYIKPITLDADADYREVLEASMVKERQSVATYEGLAAYVEDAEAKRVFTFLRDEEKKHLKRFEDEYDDLGKQKY